MAQSNSQLPEPKPEWAVLPKQEWYYKHGSGGLLDDPRQACPDWLWLEALSVWQQKYTVGVAAEGEQGNSRNWEGKYRARYLLCERLVCERLLCERLVFHRPRPHALTAV